MRARLKDLSFSREGETIITLSTKEDFRATFDDLNGKDLDVSFKEHREKRSLNANSYCWILLDKLAAKTGYPKLHIYRDAVRNVGGNTEHVCVQDEAVQKLREGWEHNGLGWITDTMPSKIQGCTVVILYYGSSTFDTAQMSRMIDNLVQDCRSLGIETMPPDRLNALLEEWHG